MKNRQKKFRPIIHAFTTIPIRTMILSFILRGIPVFYNT